MEELKKSVENFIKSVENSSDIVVVQNNLSLLIAQLNIFYYKNIFLNKNSCSFDNSLKLNELDDISNKIRNIYPKYIELRKIHFKKTFIDKLQCNKNPNELIDNITRSNKLQKMMTNLTELLYFEEEPDLFGKKTSKTSKTIIIITIICLLFIILAASIIIGYKYYKNKKSDSNVSAVETA
jgi:hypothetical protein